MASAKGLIVGIIFVVIGLMVFASIAPDAVVDATNTTALTAGGVADGTIAVYGLIGIIALISIVIMFLKVATSGR